MAITFTNARSFLTDNNTVILANQQSASLFWWFRYEPQGSKDSAQIGDCEIIGRRYDSGAYALLWGSSVAGSVTLNCGYQAQGGQTASYPVNLAVGTSYPILMVFAQGQQTLYLPGQTFTLGTLTGPIASSNQPFLVGGIPPGSPCVYTLGDVNCWNGYACTAADYNALVLGADPTTIGQSATTRYRWTLSGTSGATPTIGDPGLAESYAGVYNLSYASGTGSAVYTAPLGFQPAVQISPLTRVGTSGQTVFFFFQTIATGAPTAPISISTAPMLYQNGVYVGQLTNSFLDSTRPFVQYNVPVGVQINPGDIVSVAAPNLWCITAAGPVASLSGTTIANKSGMSAFGTESLKKTFRPGMNFSHLGTNYYNLYRLTRNQRFNISPFLNSTSAPDGTPLTTPSNGSIAYLEDFTSQNNEIDSTNYPSQAGLRAIGWNSPTSSTTTFAISTDDNTSCIVTERTDLANPGDGSGNGRVRVFDCQPAPGSATASFRLFVDISPTSSTPNFSNLDIRGPGDFTHTDGQPVTLDNSNPYTLSAVTLDRLQHGIGCARFMDSTIAFAGSSNMWEPWHLRNITDFAWGDGTYTTALNITYTQARPYAPTTGSYIYGPAWILPAGSPFTATLASPIDNATTTLTISDAATAPVIIGLTLAIDSELLTVRNVSGTTVTVARGAGGTTPAAHSAGSIQVQNRQAITSLSQVATNQDQITELVCSAPHGLVTGLPQMTYAGTWPTFAYTDGSTANFQSEGAITTIAVTGPTTFITKVSWLQAITDGPVTLSQSYTLSGATTWIALPESGFPYEFTAKVSGNFPGCWHHVNVPLCASDSMAYEIARRIRDNFPAGRKVLVELCNEPWNYAFHQLPAHRLLNQLAYGSSGSNSQWLVRRSNQVWQIFQTVFGAIGRSSEIAGLINVQCVDSGQSQDVLAIAQTQNVTTPFGIAIGPYIDPDQLSVTVAAYNAANTAQVIDLWIHDLFYSATALTPSLRGHQANIATFNAATGLSCFLYAYEWGPETAVPDACTNARPRNRDVFYHPNFWIVQQDMFAWAQQMGLLGGCLYAYDMVYFGNNTWGVYTGPAQPYGRGDGSDEKQDNRLCLATPGHTYSKAPNVNQDQQNVSVRGSAFLHWMQASNPPKTPKKITFRRRR